MRPQPAIAHAHWAPVGSLGLSSLRAAPTKGVARPFAPALAPFSPRQVWGYFSVKSGGGIHEFSDSQFGHLFAKGETREAAIRAMVVALRDVRVRGEIHTIIDYAVDMITSPEFTQVGGDACVLMRGHMGWKGDPAGG